MASDSLCIACVRCLRRKTCSRDSELQLKRPLHYAEVAFAPACSAAAFPPAISYTSPLSSSADLRIRNSDQNLRRLRSC